MAFFETWSLQLIYLMLLFQMIEEISSPIDFFTQVVKYDLIWGEKNLEFLKLRSFEGDF